MPLPVDRLTVVRQNDVQIDTDRNLSRSVRLDHDTSFNSLVCVLLYPSLGTFLLLNLALSSHHLFL